MYRYVSSKTPCDFMQIQGVQWSDWKIELQKKLPNLPTLYIGLLENLEFKIKKDDGTIVKISGQKLNLQDKNKLAKCLQAQQEQGDWNELKYEMAMSPNEIELLKNEFSTLNKLVSKKTFRLRSSTFIFVKS